MHVSSAYTSSASALFRFIANWKRQRDKVKGNLTNDDVVVDVFIIRWRLWDCYCIICCGTASATVNQLCDKRVYLPPPLFFATFPLLLPSWHIYLYFNFFFTFRMFLFCLLLIIKIYHNLQASIQSICYSLFFWLFYQLTQTRNEFFINLIALRAVIDCIIEWNFNLPANDTGKLE